MFQTFPALSLQILIQIKKEYNLRKDKVGKASKKEVENSEDDKGVASGSDRSVRSNRKRPAEGISAEVPTG